MLLRNAKNVPRHQATGLFFRLTLASGGHTGVLLDKNGHLARAPAPLATEEPPFAARNAGPDWCESPHRLVRIAPPTGANRSTRTPQKDRSAGMAGPLAFPQAREIGVGTRSASGPC